MDAGLAARAPRAPLLEAAGITKLFGDFRANDGIDLTLQPGEIHALLGENGAGKSTLVKIIYGLMQPTAGELRYRDMDLTHADEEQLTLYRRQSVGFIFQFYNLIPSLTARENVALVTEITDDPMTPEEALALVGLAARQDHFPAQLSGGEQQRVAIARAMMNRPALMLADEPTGNLDARTAQQVADLLFDLASKTNSVLVVVTHSAEHAATHSSRVQ